MDQEALFELHGPEGQAWKLFEDGRVSGFPEGTVLVNRALPLLDSLRCPALAARVSALEQRNEAADEASRAMFRALQGA